MQTILVTTDMPHDDRHSLLAIPSWYAVQPNWLFIARAGRESHRCTKQSSGTFPSLSGVMISVTPNATDLAVQSSATWPAGFSVVAIFILALLASNAPTAITKCSSPFLVSNVVSVQAAIKNEPSWLRKPSRTPFVRQSHTGNWSSPFPNGCEFTAGTTAAFWAAWRATVEIYRQELKRGDLNPGMVAGIQTFGELIHFHPHIHVIVSDGGFTPGGTFICLPRINPDA